MAWYFQLTHPMRGATEAFAPAEGYFSFQLAHPVRGATRREPVIFLPSAISTPAPHEGCDWNFRATRPWSEFQLTHSMHGCDRHGRVWRRETCHFNSRTRVGCDIILIKKKRRRLVFQFTHPVWGAAQRLRTDILKIIIKYFNSRTLMRYGLTVSP